MESSSSAVLTVSRGKRSHCQLQQNQIAWLTEFALMTINNVLNFNAGFHDVYIYTIRKQTEIEHAGIILL